MIMEKKGYCLLTTKNLEKHLLFKDDDDFKYGMNLVAVLVHRKSVTILAFVLMSNHVHFVLFETREKAQDFINDFKKELSRHLFHKYKTRELLRRNDVDFKWLPFADEAVEKAIAYSQMNPVAANICLTPSAYPWGSGDTFFNLNRADGTPIKCFSGKHLRRMIHSKEKLPGEWLMGNNGYVLPYNYIDVQQVENIFRTPARMDFYLKSSSKAKLRIDNREQHLPAFRDQIIHAAIPDLCRTLFGKQTVEELRDDQLTELFRQIRFRFSASIHQIARVSGFSYERVAKQIDSE